MMCADGKYNAADLVSGQAIRPALLSRTSTLGRGGGSSMFCHKTNYCPILILVVVITRLHKYNRDDEYNTLSTPEEESLHIF